MNGKKIGIMASEIIVDIVIDDVMFDMVTSSSWPSVKLHVVDVFIDITQLDMRGTVSCFISPIQHCIPNCTHRKFINRW